MFTNAYFLNLPSPSFFFLIRKSTCTALVQIKDLSVYISENSVMELP